MSRSINVLGCLRMPALAVLALAGCDGGDFAETSVDSMDFGDVELAEDDFRYVLPVGLHGLNNNPNVRVGAVVDQLLVKKIPSNAKHVFWGFCGQSSTATAINFARGTTPSPDEKIAQLEWFHVQLLAREGGYSAADPAGPYVANISWLYSLMLDEKGAEFTMSWLTTSDRDLMKERMFASLDDGAFVVALNQTNGGDGHYLTVYAIDYQPNDPLGGTVYYADPLTGNLGTLGFKTFLDRQLAASSLGLYNAFAVEEK
jgi:hypothetical protein